MCLRMLRMGLSSRWVRRARTTTRWTCFATLTGYSSTDGWGLTGRRAQLFDGRHWLLSFESHRRKECCDRKTVMSPCFVRNIGARSLRSGTRHHNWTSSALSRVAKAQRSGLDIFRAGCRRFESGLPLQSIDCAMRCGCSCLMPQNGGLTAMLTATGHHCGLSRMQGGPFCFSATVATGDRRFDDMGDRYGLATPGVALRTPPTVRFLEKGGLGTGHSA